MGSHRDMFYKHSFCSSLEVCISKDIKRVVFWRFKIIIVIYCLLQYIGSNIDGFIGSFEQFLLLSSSQAAQFIIGTILIGLFLMLTFTALSIIMILCIIELPLFLPGESAEEDGILGRSHATSVDPGGRLDQVSLCY